MAELLKIFMLVITINWVWDCLFSHCLWRRFFFPGYYPQTWGRGAPNVVVIMPKSDEIFKDFLTRIKALRMLLEMWHLYFLWESYGETYLMGKTNCICYTNNHRNREMETYVDIFVTNGNFCNWMSSALDLHPGFSWAHCLQNWKRAMTFFKS